MSYLLQSWKESLKLFVPKNFKLFALVTLKTMEQTYSLLLSYFWWLPVATIGLLFFVIQSMPFESAMKINEILVLVFLFIWTLVVALCTRPSVGQKNVTYFVHYLYYIPIIMVGDFIFGLIPKFSYSILYLLMEKLSLQQFSFAVVVFGLLILLIQNAHLLLSLLFLFFMLDMTLSIKNGRKAFLFACKMFWYNAPVLLIITFLGQLIFILIWGFFLYVSGFMPNEISVSLLSVCIPIISTPITIAVLNNIYIKRLHEQPQLYFNHADK